MSAERSVLIWMEMQHSNTAEPWGQTLLLAEDTRHSLAGSLVWCGAAGQSGSAGLLSML